MPLFLITISLLLNLITIASLLYLYKEMQLMKRHHQNEMMEVFETYLEEIKAENKNLQEQLNPSAKQINTSPKKKTKSVYNEFLPISETISATQPDHAHVSVDHKVDLKTSLEASVLQLYHQGFSEDDIARQLNSGKTEVALIINLYGKKQHKS